MPEQPWFADLVVYQVWPRSFADGDGDGVGDLRGVIDHLDHLEWLGIDVLWLCPVYASPMADNGYDISDYRAVDPVFGTLADLDELIAAVHARGMRLVMDLVVNHTSDQHAWFTSSRSSRDDPRRDWYWWRPPREGFSAGEPGAEPTDWRSIFSGPTWTLDEASGEYYLHLFAPQQPDLRWENPAVRAAVVEMMRWWLDRGVDGFRMDVVNFISKDVGPDGSLPDAVDGDSSRHFMNGPRIHEFLAQVRREAYAGYDRPLLAIGEMPGVDVDQARLYTDPARAEVDMVFQFEHVYVDRGVTKWDIAPLDLRDLKASLGRWQEGLAEVGWNSLYLGNHDQSRVVSRWGADGEHRATSAKTLATVAHLHRGTPFVYQGDELGMANIPLTSRADLDDVESLRYHDEQVAAGRDSAEVIAQIAPTTRDNARSPVLWDTSANAGFTTGTPWFPVHGDPATTSAAVQRQDPTSVMAHHRDLVALRHGEAAVALGDFTMLLADHRWVYAFTRHHEGTHLLVLASFSTDEQDLAPLVAELDERAAGPGAGPGSDRWRSAELVLGTRGEPAAPLAPLGPWESRVLRTRGA